MIGELNETQKLLDEMLKTNIEWYENTMDTPGIAYLFNELVKKAICFDEGAKDYEEVLQNRKLKPTSTKVE